MLEDTRTGPVGKCVVEATNSETNSELEIKMICGSTFHKSAYSSCDMNKVLITIMLLIGSNCFMTWAWYGHLKRTGWTLPVAILLSWMIALPEYILQVPANRIGHFSSGGPFTVAQLKIIQEAITLIVFIVFSLLILKDKPRWNETVAFALIFIAVIFAMLGRAPILEPSSTADSPTDSTAESTTATPDE